MFRSSITTHPFRAILLIAMAITMLPCLTDLGSAATTDPTIAAVGDMGCARTNPKYNNGNGTASSCRQKYVSDVMVNPMPTGGALLLGDNQYVKGELANFQAVYHPTYGRANAVAYPEIGNAEYDTPNGQGWFDYYASVGVTSRIASTPGADVRNWSNVYYSFDVGAWHMIALNSNCSKVTGGCKAGSPQETWLKADLAAHPNQCTLAYWHHPRWNSGELGNDSTTAAFWTDLYNARADVVLVGHGNHHYERQAPQTAAGVPNANGIRQFIVSTGGEEHGLPPTTPGDQDRLEVADYTSFGALRMTLHPTSFDWQFVPEAGRTFTDSGSGTCHSAPATQVPAAPSASATADSAVHVSWNAPSSGAPITSYKLYRGTAAGAETLYKTLGNVTSYDDTAVTGGTKYYYRVAAVSSAGEGGQSNEVSATPAAGPPPPPLAFPSTASLDDFARAAGALGTNWQSPGLADPGTASIESSGVTKSASGASTATWKASTFTADQEAYLTVPTLPKAGQFIQVAGRISTLSASNPSCYFVKVTPSTSKWELRKKVNGAASTVLQTFTVPFLAGDSTGIRIAGSTITAYRKTGSGAWTSVGSATDTAIPGAGYVGFTLGDTTVRGGAFGGGSVTTPPPAQSPAAPSLSATADTAVHLSWSVPSDGGAAITSYNIYRGTAAGGETLLKNAGNVTSYDDTAVASATKYYYRVAAVNSVGEGSQSNEASATTAAPAPQSPAAPALSATADTAVHLSWNAPSDGGAAISGYKLYRGTSAGGETLLTSPGNVTTYNDSAVASGATYYYRVAAVNSVGEGTQSNEVSATPAASPPPPAQFPTTTVLDSFARPAGALGADWRSPALADPGTVTIDASGLTKSSAGASSATWSTQTFTANQEAYLTVPTLPNAGQFFQIAGRVSTLTTSNVSCYFLRVTPSTSTWDLRKKVNGGGSTSLKTFKLAFAAGDTAGLQLIGSTLTAYRKPAFGSWASVVSATDTAIPGAGYLSFTLGDTTIRGGAFGGGNAS